MIDQLLKVDAVPLIAEQRENQHTEELISGGAREGWRRGVRTQGARSVLAATADAVNRTDSEPDEGEGAAD